ncbi:viroplasmin family protein [Solibacillus cecembensis]|uniref:ribonuclease H1 domain-containing protein n=1 Tax=Solibacillus cecembensis TaxID=459347 RepID=UPI003D08FFB0
MNKFYAVKSGRKTGIFTTWAECEKSVKGYKGAIYKSFPTQKEAEQFLNVSFQDNKTNISSSDLCVYVDGSYSKINNSGGYGCVMVIGNKIIHTLSEPIQIDIDDNLWNVEGEIKGALAAIQWAIKNNYNSVQIFYDYAGIEHWANGSWKANKTLSKAYTKKIQEYSNQIAINFNKVKAHSGDTFNELADQLAKEATYMSPDFSIEKKPNKSSSDILNIDLYKTIIGTLGNEKIALKYHSFIFNDQNLKKIAKYFWKISGYKIKDLTDLQVTLDLNLNSLQIEYITQNEKITKTIELEVE